MPTRVFNGKTIKLVTYLATFLVAILISENSYAASASISTSSQNIELNLVPSMTSSGSGVSNHTVNVKTDCSSGYNVYASATSSGDNKLHLDGNSSNTGATNSISASSNTMSSPSSLSANTWGVGTSNSAFSGVPAYSELSTSDQSSNPTALYSSNNTGPGAGLVTGEDKTIYYSANVNTSLEPGSYSGNVLYTVIMQSSCYGYTVSYNANGGTGTMTDQTIMPSTETSLKKNTFTRSGYTFYGWATSSSATERTYIDADKVTDLTTVGDAITLYALWKPTITMQNWEGCSSLAENTIAYLTDTRDNTIYKVKKLADGKCWMITNLTLGSKGGVTLTSSNTNLATGTTYYLPPAGYMGDPTSSETLASTTEANFADDSTSSQYFKVQYKTASENNSAISSHANNAQSSGYYDFYTATARYAYYGENKTGSSSYDICPAGWRLPKVITSTAATKDGTGEFKMLMDGYGASWSNTDWADTTPYASNVNTQMRTGDATALNNYVGFVIVGNFSGMQLNNPGSSGGYWSSTVAGAVYDDDISYGLHFSTSRISPQNTSLRHYGLSVRCLADATYTINYNANGGTGAASKTTETISNSIESVTTASVGTLEKSGYTFKGWSTNASVTAADYDADTSVLLRTLTPSATSHNVITLYAVWEQSTVAMQDWQGCPSLNSGETITLKDTRNGVTYRVRKLLDGNCWTIDNFKLTPDGTAPGDTNITSGTVTLTASDSEAAGIIEFVSDFNRDQVWDDDHLATTSDPPRSFAIYDSSTGQAYYSPTASMMVCPSGWRLPSSNRDYVGLFNAYGTSSLDNVTSASNNGPQFKLSGFYSGSSLRGSGEGYYSHPDASVSFSLGSSSYVMSNPIFLSSTHYANGTFTQLASAVNQGYSVRCMVGYSTSTMQGFDCQSFLNSTTTLIDIRDNQTYGIYKIPPSSSASNVAGKCIMTDNLKLGMVTGGDIIGSTNLSLTEEKSNFDSNAYNASYDKVTYSSTETVKYIASTNASSWSSTNSYTNKQYTYSSGDYAFGYYSWGAALVVCPSGWRLPISSEYNNSTSWNSSTTGISKAANNSIAALMASPWNFKYTGLFSSSGFGNNQSLNGFYWSATQVSADYSYNLHLLSSGGVVLNGSHKNFGRAVRCIAD